MDKKLLIVIIFLLSVLCTGCNGCSGAYVGSDTASKDDKIEEDFKQIKGFDNLYYCKDTKVVYWIGGSYTVNVIGDDYTTSYMTVYYAPNGFPYLYDEDEHKIYELNYWDLKEGS